MAPQVGLESPCKRNYNNLAGSRWHVLPAFRCDDLGTARKRHGRHVDGSPDRGLSSNRVSARGCVLQGVSQHARAPALGAEKVLPTSPSRILVFVVFNNLGNLLSFEGNPNWPEFGSYVHGLGTAMMLGAAKAVEIIFGTRESCPSSG